MTSELDGSLSEDLITARTALVHPRTGADAVKGVAPTNLGATRCD